LGLILEILNVFLWLKFLPFLTSNKIEHFETGSFFQKKKARKILKAFMPFKTFLAFLFIYILQLIYYKLI